ncbi:MAG: thiosulfate oxidation carrier protein SoxY, partial [Pseudomonadota bacterium]
MVPEDSPLVLNRRAMIGGAGGLALIGLSPLTASAAPEDLRAAIEERFGDRSIEEARVTLKAPPIAENGYSVPITVSVDSP